MATSFQAKSADVQNVQLKVQEVCVRLSDTSIVSVSANDVTIDFGEVLSQVRLATFFDDSAGTNAPVVASNQTFTAGTSTTLKLAIGAAMASGDSITVKYVTDETA